MNIKSKIIWSVVAVLVVAGCIYIWTIRTVLSHSASTMPQSSVAPVSSSDDVNSIENDLKATNPGPDASSLDSIQ